MISVNKESIRCFHRSSGNLRAKQKDIIQYLLTKKLIYMAFKGQIVVDTDHCKGCGLCVEACPMHVIELSKHVNGKGYNYSEPVKEGCIGCASCALICPDGVISVYKVKC